MGQRLYTGYLYSSFNEIIQIQSLFISQPDDCNFLLVGVLLSTTKLLQLFQDAATALIQFKICTLTRKAINRSAPRYLQGLLKPCTVPHNLRTFSFTQDSRKNSNYTLLSTRFQVVDLADLLTF